MHIDNKNIDPGLIKFFPARCPKCGGFIYSTAEKLNYGNQLIASLLINEWCCVNCGFCTSPTGLLCNICGQEIVEQSISREGVSCLGCHDQWTSDFAFERQKKIARRRLLEQSGRLFDLVVENYPNRGP